MIAHDAMNAASALALSAYATTVASAPQVPMDDVQVVIVSLSAGLIGGLIATLSSEATVTKRDLAKRMLASGMAAPGIVLLALVYYVPEPTLLKVVAISGVAGLVAWPVAESLPKLVPSALKTLLKRWFAADSADKPTGDK